MTTKRYLTNSEPIHSPDVPTWEDIQRAAMNGDTGLYHLVTVVELGRLTREQALMRYALVMAEQARQAFCREVDRLMMEPAQPFIVPNAAATERSQ